MNLLKIKDSGSRIGSRELQVRDTGRVDVAWKCDTVCVRRVETGAAHGLDDRKVEQRMAASPSLDQVDFGNTGTSGV